MGKYKVLNRTVETTNAHVELDKSGVIEETWNDVSASYDAYTKYDEVEVTTPDTSIDEDTKDQVRHTHLNTGEKLSEKIMKFGHKFNLNTFYIYFELMSKNVELAVTATASRNRFNKFSTCLV